MMVATSSPNTWKIGAELIKWYQGTDFSHVLIIDGELVYQASHGLVNCMHITNFLAHNVILDKYEISPDKVDMSFVKHQLGKPYSYKQLFLIPLFKLFKIKYKGNNQAFICSEYVGKALKLPWVTDLTTPKEIDAYLRNSNSLN